MLVGMELNAENNVAFALVKIPVIHMMELVFMDVLKVIIHRIAKKVSYKEHY